MATLAVRVMMAAAVLSALFVGAAAAVGRKLKTLELDYISTAGTTTVVYAFDMTTGITHILGGTEGVSFFAWSPDGQQLAFMVGRSENNPLYIMSGDGYNRRPIAKGAYTEKSPWSPDGQQLVYSHNDSGIYRLYVIGIQDSQPRLLTGEATSNAFPQWSPDGQYIAYLTSNRMVLALGVKSVNGNGQWVLDGLINSGFSWSPSGHVLAFPTANGISLADVAAGTQTHLSDLPSPDNAPSWSPDGHALSVVSIDAQQARSISTTNRDGSNRKRLVENLTINLAMPVSWSADGTQIAFVAYPPLEMDAEIYSAQVEDGSVHRITFNDVPDWLAVWRP